MTIIFQSVEKINNQMYRIDIEALYKNERLCWIAHKIIGNGARAIFIAKEMPCMTKTQCNRFPKAVAKKSQELLNFVEKEVVFNA